MDHSRKHGGVHEFEATTDGITFKVDFDENGKGFFVSAYDENGVPYVPSPDETDAFVLTAETFKTAQE